MPVCHHIISTHGCGVYETQGKIGDSKVISSTHALLSSATCTPVIIFWCAVEECYIFTSLHHMRYQRNETSHIKTTFANINNDCNRTRLICKGCFHQVIYYCLRIYYQSSIILNGFKAWCETPLWRANQPGTATSFWSLFECVNVTRKITYY